MPEDKGSKRHLQVAISASPKVLAGAIGDALPALVKRSLIWRSPLVSDGYREYRDRGFLKALDLEAHHESLRRFWPARGPHWDALATIDGGERGVILIEAKAHVGETKTPDPCRAGQASKPLIEAAFTRTRSYLGVPPAVRPWTEHHYQVANRLAHLWWLHVELGVPAWLVFLGFTESPKWPADALTPSGWSSQIAAAMSDLGVPAGDPLADRVGVAVMRAP